MGYCVFYIYAQLASCMRWIGRSLQHAAQQCAVRRTHPLAALIKPRAHLLFRVCSLFVAGRDIHAKELYHAQVPLAPSQQGGAGRYL